MGLQLKGGKEPGRNDLCPCGSKLKFKYCHGDNLKREVCNRVANEKMVWLILEEKKKRGLVPRDYKCNTCGHSFDEPQTSTISDYTICPYCQSTNIEKLN